MISKQIGQSPEYYLMYEILRSLNKITNLAPNIGWISNTPSGYTPSTQMQDWLTRIDLLGFPRPDESVIQALDEEFVIKAVSDGSWTLIDDIVIKAFNDVSLENTATVKLKYRTNQLTIPTNTIYTNAGPVGNAVSSFIDFTFNPVTNGVNYVQNSASRGIWVYTSGNLVLDGIVGVNNNSIINQLNAAQRINQGGTNLNIAPNMAGVGYKAINRSSNNDVQTYNELIKTNATATSSSLISSNQMIGRRANTFFSSTFSMYYMGGSLSEIQHNNIRNNFRAYLTRIGL